MSIASDLIDVGTSLDRKIIPTYINTHALETVRPYIYIHKSIHMDRSKDEPFLEQMDIYRLVVCFLFCYFVVFNGVLTFICS